ncbi:MAG: HD domain-containing protein [Lachnospiraceae bacterium]|nr:HD domain-containing protein [Lachnospiraceae bacterium]
MNEKTITDERLKKQIRFISEIDKIKSIFRQTYVSDLSRQENDAEHSWHLALMAMVLSEYANEEVDVLHVIELVLIHDMVEIDAGDTYAYDPEANKTKRERELKAAERIFHLLPDDQAEWVRSLWDEYEASETKEAKFALSLDILHPILMNDLGNGLAWVDHDVTEKQARDRIARVLPGSQTLFDLCSQIVTDNVEIGNILPMEAENGTE